MAKKNPHVGSSFDDFLKEEGIYEEVSALAMKRVLVREIEEEMQALGLSKAELARRMKTSRPQIDRLLDPSNQSLTIETLARAAKVIGRRIHLELV